MKKYVALEKGGKIYNLEDPVDRYIFKLIASKEILDYATETVSSFSKKTVKTLTKDLAKQKR